MVENRVVDISAQGDRRLESELESAAHGSRGGGSTSDTSDHGSDAYVELPEPHDVDTGAKGGKALKAVLHDLDAARKTLEACQAVRCKHLPATVRQACAIATGKAEEEFKNCELAARECLAEYNGNTTKTHQQARAAALAQWLESAEHLMAEGLGASELIHAAVERLTVQRAVSRRPVRKQAVAPGSPAFTPSPSLHQHDGADSAAIQRLEDKIRQQAKEISLLAGIDDGSGLNNGESLWCTVGIDGLICQLYMKTRRRGCSAGAAARA